MLIIFAFNHARIFPRRRIFLTNETKNDRVFLHRLLFSLLSPYYISLLYPRLLTGDLEMLIQCDREPGSFRNNSANTISELICWRISNVESDSNSNIRAMISTRIVSDLRWWTQKDQRGAKKERWKPVQSSLRKCQLAKVYRILHGDSIDLVLACQLLQDWVTYSAGCLRHAALTRSSHMSPSCLKDRSAKHSNQGWSYTHTVILQSCNRHTKRLRD
jgi:hypothetical protein